MFRGHANLKIDICQAVSAFQYSPWDSPYSSWSFPYSSWDFPYSSWDFRIVSSQFLQFSDPRNGRDGFWRFLRFHFWALEGYGWHVALRGHKLSRKSFEEIQGYRSRLGMENQIWNLPGFWNQGARWFNSRGPPSLCCFSGWLPTATPRTSMMHFFHHWQEPTCRFVHVADDFHPTHILKGILGRLLWAILFWLYHWIMVSTILCGRANAYIKTTFKARRTRKTYNL